MDKSLSTITLTLWNNDAESFNANFGQPVILVKNARVSEFNGGKSLSVGVGSTMKVNPDIKEGHQLRGWYDNEGHTKQTSSLSTRVGSVGNFNTEWLTFHEAKGRNLGEGDKPDWFQLCGVINLIRTNNAVYKACATVDCNKKVVDMENGQFRCEKCNINSHNFKYRLMVNVSMRI